MAPFLLLTIALVAGARAQGMDGSTTCDTLEAFQIPSVALNALVAAGDLTSDDITGDFVDLAALFSLESCDAADVVFLFNTTEYTLPVSALNMEVCSMPEQTDGCLRVACNDGVLTAVLHLDVCCDATDGVEPTLSCAILESQPEVTCATVENQLFLSFGIDGLLAADEISQEDLDGIGVEEAAGIFSVDSCQGSSASVTFNETQYRLPISALNFDSCLLPNFVGEDVCLRATCNGGELSAVVHLGVCCDATTGVDPTVSCAFFEGSSGALSSRATSATLAVAVLMTVFY